MPRRDTFTAGQFACNICGKGCRSPSGLKRHKDYVHPTFSSAAPPPSPPSARRAAASSQPPSPGFGGPSFSPPPPPSSPSPSPSSLPRRQRIPTPEPDVRIERHRILDGTPCDAEGRDLPPGTPPPPWDELDPDDYGPFDSSAQFEFADFLYKREQMSGGSIDHLMHLMAGLYTEDPFVKDHRQLYAMIDAIQQGSIPWRSFSVQYTGPRPNANVPSWMTDTYEVWFRDPLAIFERQLANPDFADELDWAPKRIFKNGKRQWTDFFSGNWVWEQADIIARDEDTHGALFVPVILGSDKTTVSIGTGNTEFWPLYGGIGNTFNSTRRAHRDGIALLAFLAIPKTTREYAKSNDFRKFRRQLFHSSIRRVLDSLKQHMTKPKITRCADRHFRRAIYGIGPDISDYPEQCLITCVVQGYCPVCLSPATDLDQKSPLRSKEHTAALLDTLTLKQAWDNYGVVGDVIPFTDDLPRADIHQLISVDLLHQIIKGTFKDHIVDWVELYIREVNEPAEAERILADIDRRIAVAPPFPGLRRFPVGRGFKQWTGNDSKGLMKVYIPAIAGHVPNEMLQAVSALVEFCYLVRRSVISEDDLQAIDDAVSRFHRYREAFRIVRADGFSLPRQHSMVHYRPGIEGFAVPNGLCSSITESKHIRAIKRPYRRSNRNKPLGQMLLTNQRIDKLEAARADFKAHGMLDGWVPPEVPASAPGPSSTPDEPETAAQGAGARERDELESGEVEGPKCMGEVRLAKNCVRKVPRDVHRLALHVQQPRLHELIRRFLFEQLNPARADESGDITLANLPEFSERVFTYNSARAMFYAPSDVCGIGGMRQERIRATKSWYRGPPRYDCALIEHDTDAAGFRGLHAVRVRLLMRFTYRGVQYPCALVHWFSAHGDGPCPDTGMWIVKPDWVRGSRRTEPELAVVHLDAMLRAVHLIGVAGKEFLPSDAKDLDYSDSLDAFEAFYVNKYADYHAHEILF
ncbi:hypothetical protein HMN09_00998700 [Mycena chlorophos]|uniref:C2H2-type domain-containing protein n=1 Tax=Mycena chlorophos TaxID=658473 RepID=A0A8H6W1V1_MYCCL|nr:hypothetical protein HMN09_00998700 [Mycena chlorophos]